jgi:hypothetical protein
MNPIILVKRTIVVLKLGNTFAKRSPRYKQIIQAATGNAWITSLTPAIAQVTQDVGALDAAAVPVKFRAPGAVAARDLKDRTCKEDMEAWARIVQVAVDANPSEARAIIESMSMFVKVVSNRDKLPLAIEVQLVPGTVKAIAKAGPRGQRVFLEVQYTPDGGKSWLPGGMTTDSSIVIAGLPSATWVGFRCRSWHKNVPGPWSQVVTELVR